MIPAWVYYHAARAGLSRTEAAYLPIGQVLDQISCWMIEERGIKQAMTDGADIFDFPY